MSNCNKKYISISFIFYTVYYNKILLYTIVLRRISITLVYYGLSISATNIAGDKYLNFILVSLIEIPACILYWLVMEGMPRKMSLSYMFLLSGVTCVLYNLTSEGEYPIILK